MVAVSLHIVPGEGEMSKIYLGPEERQAIYDAVFSAFVNDPQIRQAIYTGTLDAAGKNNERISELEAENAELRKVLAEGRNTGVKDADGTPVFEGDLIDFSYGMPGVGVRAPVVFERGSFYVETPEHNPKRCALRQLKKHVGEFWVHQDEGQRALKGQREVKDADLV